jgi:murein DD-endopeptidase MepM/ murein hydrolase activator NlpD
MSKQAITYGVLTTVGVTLLVLILRQIQKSSGFIKPVNGKLTSGFGLRIDPTDSTNTQGHNGQDIAVPIGTPVKAPLDGTVVSTASSTDGGNQVILLHQDKGPYQNWKTGYAHLSKVLVKVGDKVKKGQSIALSGNTGAHTTGPHLHFTISNAKNIKVDPKLYAYK